MAIYHCTIKIISRGKGKSAVAAAAYRAGEDITSEYDGITHDYSRKRGVVHTEILLSEHAPAEYADRSILWNAVEKIEKAKNSQLAREVELALPVELSREQNISLVRDYVQRNFVSTGMCADICIHDKNDGNPHAHILLTMRPFIEDKTWGDKQKKEYALDKNGDKIYDPKKRQYKCKSVPTTDWNEQTKAEEWRAAWAESVNTVLKQQNISERVDHRSFERQGVEQIPTVHMGVAATQMEQRGIKTERGNANREIVRHNHILFGIINKLKQLKDWLKETISPTSPPTLAVLLKSVLENGEQDSRYGNIRDLKIAAYVYSFMKKNDISKMSELREMYAEAHGHYNNTRKNVLFYEQRMKTLDENIRQGGIYLKYKDLYTEYKKLKLRKQPKFYETHQTELALFGVAKHYFEEHHISADFSINDWGQERENLLAKRADIYYQYKLTQTDFVDVENARLGAEQIIRNLNTPPQRKLKSRDMER